jgi:hypothetical protein
MLEHDESGSREREERLFTALVTTLPRRVPAPDFTARLLTATRTAWPGAADQRFWTAARSELAISAGVVAGAALLTLLPVILIGLAFVFDASIVVSALARVCVLLVEWLNAGLSFWDVLARAARIGGAALASPVGTFMLLGGVLTASLALAGLSRVLPGEQGEL